MPGAASLGRQRPVDSCMLADRYVPETPAQVVEAKVAAQSVYGGGTVRYSLSGHGCLGTCGALGWEPALPGCRAAVGSLTSG
jgi:hypothetical protein